MGNDFFSSFDSFGKLGGSGGGAAAAGSGGLALQWSDDFDRANSNDIGGDWTDVQSAPPGLSISGGAMIHSGNFNNGAGSAGAGLAVGNAVSEYKSEWTLDPTSWSADGFTIGHLTDDVDVAANMEFQAADGYYLEPTGASSLRLMRLLSGVATELAVWATGSLAGASHKYTIHQVYNGAGTECTITVSIDDVEAGSYVDSSPPGLDTISIPACTSRAVGLTTFTLVSVYY